MKTAARHIWQGGSNCSLNSTTNWRNNTCTNLSWRCSMIASSWRAASRKITLLSALTTWRTHLRETCQMKNTYNYYPASANAKTRLFRATKTTSSKTSWNSTKSVCIVLNWNIRTLKMVMDRTVRAVRPLRKTSRSLLRTSRTKRLQYPWQTMQSSERNNYGPILLRCSIW